MQIKLDNFIPKYNCYNVQNKKGFKTTDIKYTLSGKAEEYPVASYYTNISFCGNKHERFLLEQTDRLLCAYSGKYMFSPQQFLQICNKLKKKPNLQSATNYLFQFQKDYMHPTESAVFDMLNSKETLKYHGNETFQDVLMREKPASLERLKSKQLEILTSTDPLIEKLEPSFADMVKSIRDKSIEKINNGTFCRKSPLDLLRLIKSEGRNQGFIDLIYRRWYTLPSSSNNYDAFIVKYANSSHEQIATRLISPAEATIEHITPKSKNGISSLSNYLLVSAVYNNVRSSDTLNRFMSLHSDLDIPKHLQKYINTIIAEVNDKKSPFRRYAWYPKAVAEAIEEVTKGKVKLDISGMQIPQKEINQKDIYVSKLGKKYTVKKMK